MGRFEGLPPLGNRTQQWVALGFTIIGAAGTAVGLEASGALDQAANKPPAHEVTVPTQEVFQIAGKLCVDGTVYGVVNNKVELLPNEGCSQNTNSFSGNVSIDNH